MPEILGLVLVALVALMVGLVSLGVGTADVNMFMVAMFLVPAAMFFGVVAVFSYLNDNMFATALFGFLAVFFWAFPDVFAGAAVSALYGLADLALFILFGAVVLLAMTFVSTAQPVKMVTGVIGLAALTFLFLGIWVWDGFATGALWGMLTGIFGVLAGLLSLYLPVAILYNTMKGQNALPLM